MSSFARFVPVLVAGLVVLSSSPALGIEAIPGKKYKLTKRHGPWMIMVASFKMPPPERRLEDGLTPEQAADKLVYELRKVGIPAYTYSRDPNQLLKELNPEPGVETVAYTNEEDEVIVKVPTIDRMGRETERKYKALREEYCVLAGNYETNDESTKSGRLAKETLEWIENNFKPDFLTELDPDFARAGAASRSTVRQLKSGGILRITPGKAKQGSGPLAGAFLTLNPMLSPKEIKAMKRDPLLVKLNSGNDLSLYNNPGKYTLVVASFYGKSSKAQVGMVGMANFREAQKSFTVGESLDEAADSAWEVATLLRQGYFVTNLNEDDDPTTPALRPHPTAMEAWIWHDRFKSVVTVGSFDSLEDPRIKQYQRAFSAKIKEHAMTRKPFLAAAQLTIPAIPGPNQLPEKIWIFDPKPQLVEVPKMH